MNLCIGIGYMPTTDCLKTFMRLLVFLLCM